MIAKAPSNIALIKYMGKKDSERNEPTNPSLSMTLDGLCTYTEATPLHDTLEVRWIPEIPRLPYSARCHPPRLDNREQARGNHAIEKILHHLPEVFQKFKLSLRDRSGFEIRTANTFPSSAGIASSASSFAALTLAIASTMSENAEEFQELFTSSLEFKRELAQISRQCSGSSCRSFEGPWVAWEGEQVRAIEAALPEMTDLVLIVSRGAKKTSSSEAHRRVPTSPLWQERPNRAFKRFKELESALKKRDFKSMAAIAWLDYQDMHQLFHSSQPPFSYYETLTIEVLSWLQPQLKALAEGGGKPPIVTLDAGPNIHFITPTEESAEWKSRLTERFPKIEILEDHQGRGATLIEALAPIDSTTN